MLKVALKNCEMTMQQNEVNLFLAGFRAFGTTVCGGGGDGVEIETDSLLCQRQLQVTTQATVATESSTVYVSGYLYSKSVVEEVVSEPRVSSVKRVVS